MYAPLRIGGLQKFDLETGEMVQEVACARADCSASVDRNELFTLEASGLLTAWSLEGKAAEAALTAGSAWPGTPPADLPQLLASGGTLRAANSWPPFSQADKNGQSMARWLIVSATALAVLLLTAGVAVVRRRRNRK